MKYLAITGLTALGLHAILLHSKVRELEDLVGVTQLEQYAGTPAASTDNDIFVPVEVMPQSEKIVSALAARVDRGTNTASKVSWSGLQPLDRSERSAVVSSPYSFDDSQAQVSREAGEFIDVTLLLSD